MADLSGTDNTTPAPSSDKALNRPQLSTLVNMESPEAVHEEVLEIIGLIHPEFDAEPVHRVFRFTADLYNGKLEAYKACNTDYHNLRHITDTYLAMARLLHGAHLSGENFTGRQIFLGLTSALMHDAGMIQDSGDQDGTGAKYTEDHVQLSMDFVEKHSATIGLDSREVRDLRDMILCTDLMADINAIDFSSEKIELLGKALGTADLIAQMGDRTYLEKLLFLFHEFREADMGDFKDEVDFLHQTINFFEISEKRFAETLDNTSRFMVPHFKARWDIDENLYLVSVRNQRAYLQKILDEDDRTVYRKLKRGNIVEKVRKKFGDEGLGE